LSFILGVAVQALYEKTFFCAGIIARCAVPAKHKFP
jgi:hypothetical protein